MTELVSSATRYGYGYRPSTSKWDSQVRTVVASQTEHDFYSDAWVPHGVRPNGQTAGRYPDLTFRSQKMIVFLDGCYWHGCPDHYPTRATPYDQVIVAGLESHGWKVLRIWEHCGVESAAEQIIEALAVAA